MTCIRTVAPQCVNKMWAQSLISMFCVWLLWKVLIILRLCQYGCMAFMRVQIATAIVKAAAVRFVPGNTDNCLPLHVPSDAHAPVLPAPLPDLPLYHTLLNPLSILSESPLPFCLLHACTHLHLHLPYTLLNPPKAFLTAVKTTDVHVLADLCAGCASACCACWFVY